MQRAEREDAQILVCYDGSDDAKRAVDMAAVLFGPRHAVVLNVAPAMTLAEDQNKADALIHAEAGAARARRAGLQAEARATIARTTWQGIIDVADELEAAAIVIGSRDLGGPGELAGSSLSHAVATLAGRPVLVVPSALGAR
jgi:nucleotide-binding universal stress UspA family protein